MAKIAIVRDSTASIPERMIKELKINYWKYEGQ